MCDRKKQIFFEKLQNKVLDFGNIFLFGMTNDRLREQGKWYFP